MKLDLENKRVLITGSNRGTGKTIAEKFLAEGARVIFHSIEAGASQESARQAGTDTFVWGDITTEAGSTGVIQQCMAISDGLDILVNNYGEADRGTWANSTTDDWIRLYQINTLSVVRLTQGFLSSMPRGGRIINLGTIGSSRPNNVMPHYYAAKGALANLTVSLAKESGPRGITTNLVSPGLIRTEEVEARFMKTALKQGWGDSFEAAEARITAEYFPNPLGRMATREEVANVVLFLASSNAAFINGQNIRVDGGAVDTVS